MLSVIKKNYTCTDPSNFYILNSKFTLTAFLVLYINLMDVLYFVFADQDYNECDKAEQEYNEEEHIYTNYTEGTVVWARMSGFPWQVL